VASWRHAASWTSATHRLRRGASAPTGRLSRLPHEAGAHRSGWLSQRPAQGPPLRPTPDLGSGPSSRAARPGWLRAAVVCGRWQGKEARALPRATEFVTALNPMTSYADTRRVRVAVGTPSVFVADLTGLQRSCLGASPWIRNRPLRRPAQLGPTEVTQIAVRLSTDRRRCCPPRRGPRAPGGA